MAGRYASEPPAGQQRTVDHPPNRRQEIIVVGTIALAIGITALSLRLFTRVHILRKRIKLDDCKHISFPRETHNPRLVGRTDAYVRIPF